MAEMYPDDQTIELFGENIKWPSLDPDTGKFTNGSFSDPLKKPSFIPAETINLILDNLSELIKKLGETPNNNAINQLATLFTSAAVAKKGIIRDVNGSAKIATPVEADDIARKDTVDTETQRAQEVESTLQTQMALKAPLASPTFTGTPKVPSKTAAAGSDGTLIATEAQVNLKANLASPAITGSPTVGGHKIAVVANNTGVNDTNLPIGSYVFVLGSASTTISRNASSTIYLTSGADFSYVNSSLPSNQGTALDGTWRSCGIGLNSGSYRDSIFRRIS